MRLVYLLHTFEGQLGDNGSKPKFNTHFDGMDQIKKQNFWFLGSDRPRNIKHA